jgi:hypothetical protein
MNGGYHSIKHKSNQPHLMKDKAELSWEWPAQQQETWGSKGISYAVWLLLNGTPLPTEKKVGTNNEVQKPWEATVLSWYFSRRATYLLTPWSRVLLEKPTSLQLVKKFPTFYGILRFIIAFASARHLSLSWASSIPSIPPLPLPEDLS